MSTSVEDFVQEFNWIMGNAVGELDINNPDELEPYLRSVVAMIQENCGVTVNVDVINNKGQIKVLGEEYEN